MARYSTTPIFTTEIRKKPFYGTTKYPEVPLEFSDIYVITTVGDRIDVMANEFYGDSSLYWIIASANPQLTQQSMFPPIGIQIRISQNIGALVNNFNILNSV